MRRLAWLALLPGALAACGPAPDGEAVQPVERAETADNGLSWNGISFNGISFNGIAWNGIAWNGIAWNGIAWNGIAWNGIAWNGVAWQKAVARGLADPTINELVAYTISCALPASDSVTFDVAGKRYTFAGDLGLAPEWKTRACDGECQRWVSACLLARSNATGAHVRISLRGENPGLKVEPHEVRDFPRREAAYYGNLFAARPAGYACLPPKVTEIPRACGPSLADCPMKVVGRCEDVCEGPGEHQSYRDCAASARARRGERFPETITVFLAE